MKVIINGKTSEIQGPVTIAEFIKSKNVGFGEVVLQYNGNIIDNAYWAKIHLEENDELELLRFVGGG